jgi:DNA-binding transcriptional MerR regulator
MPDGPLDVDAKLTASQAAEYAGVTVQAIVNWRQRGHLHPAGFNGEGRRVYRLLDVAKAEHATRGRARRGQEAR